MNKTIIDNNRTYVLVDTDKSDRKVFCYEDGKILWQVEEPPKLHERNYFTSIYMQEADLYAYCQNGIEVKINKQTGEILSSELIK